MMITLVVPWYGPDTRGGAESQARNLAAALQRIGKPVRVWSSTGRDSFAPAAPGMAPGSAPHYPPGEALLDGLPVRRFPAGPADADGLSTFLRRHPELWPPDYRRRFAEHERRLLGTLLGSDELYAAILAQRDSSRFLFLPYPFPTSFWGAAIAGSNAFLLPCLHDEPYARYETYRYLFRRVRGLLANSPAEAALACRLYDLPAEKVCVAGEGIDRQARGEPARFYAYLAERFPQLRAESPAPNLLVYAGRRDATKNLPLLLAYLREYRASRGHALRLIMLGQGEPQLPWTDFDFGIGPRPAWPGDPLLDLGFVPEQVKHDAYAAADLFVQPSTQESFSIVLMEAWLQGTPALVHADCAVTADHARRSGGGLAFADFGEFAAALDLLLPNPALRRRLGERGQAYVLETCDWEVVARRSAAFLGL
jgi:glycosyltransferase involved in cell wall biosynthesis